jgi:uncharacterized protein YegP (UPF0339 family)
MKNETVCHYSTKDKAEKALEQLKVTTPTTKVVGIYGC